MARKSRKGLAAQELPIIPTIKVWRAALYIRLSVELNSGRGDSLETQKQIMEGYLALCPDIEIAGVYTDNGVTGQHFEREAFQRMLSDVEAGNIDCIVVKDLSRLGRNAIDTGYYIEKYFPFHHVRFIAVNDQYDSENGDKGGNHIIVPLKNMINEAYCLDLSKKIRSQAQQAMRDGEYIGARPPFGYKKDPNNCHKLLINEETAPYVRQIFKWAAEGVPLNVIVKRLNESGVVTPGYYLASAGLIASGQPVGSGKWQTWTVAKILNNQVYIGDMVQGKSKSSRRKQTPTEPDDWIIVRGTHEPLVSRELFEQAQAMRQSAAEKSAKFEKIPYTENLLRGRVFCGCCGKNLHRQKSHDRYIYHCISNDRIGKGACPSPVRLHETELFDMILTIVRQEAETVIGNNQRLHKKAPMMATKKADADCEVSKLKKETERNRSYMAKLYENYVTGVFTLAEYQEMKNSYEQKVADAVDRVQQLQGRQSELEQQVKEYASLADRLSKIGKDATLTASLVKLVIERVTVNSPSDVSICFTFENAFGRLMEALVDE